MRERVKSIVALAVIILSLVILSSCETKCEQHIGGVATCTEAGVCTECGTAYLDPMGHDFGFATDADCDRCEFVRDVSDAVVYDGGEVSIFFAHTMGEKQREVLDKYVKIFNTLYPNITVNHISTSGYDDVRDHVDGWVLSGEKCNLAYCRSDNIAKYRDAGLVASLDGFINSPAVGLGEEERANFIGNLLDEGSSFGDGEMYMMPFTENTDLLYYNKTFFDEHNISVPTTWDEMEQVCARILEIDPDSIPLGVDSESRWFINMCAQLDSPYTSATGEHYLFDNQINRAFVERFARWREMGYVTSKGIYGAYTSGLFVFADCYMSIGSLSDARHYCPDKVDGEYSFDVGAAPIPQTDTESPKVMTYGTSLCMLNSDDPREMAATWLFIKFLTTNADFQAEFAIAEKAMPVIKSATDTLVFKEYLSTADHTENLPALAQGVCIEVRDAFFTPPAFEGSTTAEEKITLLMIACLKNSEAEELDILIKREFEKAISECK